MSDCYRQKLINNQIKFQDGEISEKKCRKEEQRIIREMKQYNRQRYGFALKNEVLL